MNENRFVVLTLLFYSGYKISKMKSVVFFKKSLFFLLDL